MAQRRGAAVITGVFADADGARRAVDALIGERPAGSGSIDIALHGSDGEHTLVVAVKNDRAADHAARLLRERGAVVDADALSEDPLAMPAPMSRERTRRQPLTDEQRSLRAQWEAAAEILRSHGLLSSTELLALAASWLDLDKGSPSFDRRSHLLAVDAELREAADRLEADLRRSQPDLFDRRGRLRPTRLSERLIERAGGKTVLSGHDILALEADADGAEASEMDARPMRAP